jgi:hypothetical protein
VLGELDAKVREKVMNEYRDTETITGDEGELVFAQTWGFDVVDISKVDKTFLAVNPTLIRSEIKNGVRNIRGINIVQKRILQVRARKKE